MPTKSYPRAQTPDQIGIIKALGEDEFNTDLAFEVQTDKEQVKLVPCRECKRPLVVTTFFAPAKAMCKVCRGDGDGAREATVGQPIPGQTDPAKAVDMQKCLINKQFGYARCPMHPDDDDHTMLLISITHNDNYGPSHFMGYKEGRAQYRQTAKGETVLHQCQHGDCKATVLYSSTSQQRYAPQNQPKQAPDLGRRPGIVLEMLNGTTREEE